MDKIAKYFTYTIIPELNLIIEYFSGFVEGNDAIKLKMLEKNDTNYNPRFNILVDFRDTIINWTMASDDSLAGFIDFMKESPDLIFNRKTSLLFARPTQAILSILLKEQYSKFPIKMGLYSTLDAALINIDISKEYFQKVNEEIEKIRNTSGIKQV